MTLLALQPGLDFACAAAAIAAWVFGGAGLLRVGVRLIERTARPRYGPVVACHSIAGIVLLATACAVTEIAALAPSRHPVATSLVLAGGLTIAWLILKWGLGVRLCTAVASWGVSLAIAPVVLACLLPTRLARGTRVSLVGYPSQRIINRISGGCRAYYGDNEEYLAPDELVTKLTTSWRKRPRGRLHGPYNDRVPLRARKHGPYNGCELLKTRKALRRGETDPDEATGPVMFHDATGNPILYFRCNAATGRFEGGRTYADLAVGQPADIDAYVRGPDGLPFRRDFVLISPGANGKWDPPYDNGYTGSDDVNNFIPY